MILQQPELHRTARALFDSGLSAVDARRAIRNVTTLDGPLLRICDATFDISARAIFVFAIGKAAPAMAVALSEGLGDKITGGVITGPRLSSGESFVSDRWRVFSGGHPLPNRESLEAGKATFDLLKRANENRGLIIFLISGGGSAMIEWPVDARIGLADLREANRHLVSCGASIAEINSVRRGFSAVKGGKLAALAPNADQVTLIVSDTNRGDEANVASGPTLQPPADRPEPKEVVDRYRLTSSLPAAILAAIRQHENEVPLPAAETHRRHYVLLDNQTAVDAAATKARELGFEVQVADDINEQAIDVGCELLVARLDALKERTGGNQKPVCLLSGGEFSCPVTGDGRGGRNLETALRCAIAFDKRGHQGELHSQPVIALSAGTDGVDGNSPVAGAISDETTLMRGRALGLDAEKSLAKSDSYAFFNALGERNCYRTNPAQMSATYGFCSQPATSPSTRRPHCNGRIIVVGRPSGVTPLQSSCQSYLLELTPRERI